jgi:hypothetical protein
MVLIRRSVAQTRSAMSGAPQRPSPLVGHRRDSTTTVRPRCWRHDSMGMNPPVMAALNGDVDSGWHAAG